MKILHISDTHGSHRRMDKLPNADILVHSGDFTMTGSEAEAIDFMNWFCDLPHKHKIYYCCINFATLIYLFCSDKITQQCQELEDTTPESIRKISESTTD